MPTNGLAYSEQLDGARVARQHEVIRDLMLGSGWKTLREIWVHTDYPESSIGDVV